MEAHFIEQGLLPAENEIGDQIDPGLELYWTAWHILRDDRHFGAMGGCSTIYYTAISRYAEDHDLGGSEFSIFLMLLRAMDAEYMLWMSEQKPKAEGAPPT